MRSRRAKCCGANSPRPLAASAARARSRGRAANAPHGVGVFHGHSILSTSRVDSASRLQKPRYPPEVASRRGRPAALGESGWGPGGVGAHSRSAGWVGGEVRESLAEGTFRPSEGKAGDGPRPHSPCIRQHRRCRFDRPGFPIGFAETPAMAFSDAGVSLVLAGYAKFATASAPVAEPHGVVAHEIPAGCRRPRRSPGDFCAKEAENGSGGIPPPRLR
jgi:hypothetical protein